MKATEFCYWLQGMFEINPAKELTAEQTDMIKKHLQMVFLHEIDKSYPASQQAPLNNLHNGNNATGLMRC